jgi:protein phosphatase PTC1
MCVLSRGGRAVAMHRQHRLGGGLGDVAERKRIEAAGGKVINSRVNGVLAVSRAFGDTQLKDWSDGSDNIGKFIVTTPYDVHLVSILTNYII